MFHQSPITTLDISLHQKTIVTGGYDSKVILWTTELKPKWQFSANDLINQVVFDKTGNRIAVASADSFAYILHSHDGALIGQVGPHKDDVNAIAWHPNQNIVATVADANDIDIHFWDIKTGFNVGVLSGHNHGIFAICFDPTGRLLATAAEDGTARIWDFDSRQIVSLLEHPGDPETIDWSKCGNFVATGCDDGVLRVWEAKTGKLYKTSSIAKAAVRLVRFNDNGTELLLGSYDGKIYILGFPNLTKNKVLEANFQWERSAAFLEDGVIVGAFGCKPIKHNNQLHTYSDPGYTFGINTIACSQSFSTGPGQPSPILIGRDDGAVVNILTGKLLTRHKSIVNSVALSPVTPLVASGDYRGELILYDWISENIVASTKIDSGPINSIAWRKDGNCIATAGYDGHIRWWTPQLDLMYLTKAHSGPVKSISWSPFSDVLIAGSSDNSITGWKDLSQLFHLEKEGLVLINSVATSPNSNTFATASRDGVIRIWDLITGKLLQEMPRSHIKSIKAIAFGPNSEMIISGSYDGNVIIWRYVDEQWFWYKLNLHGKPGVSSVAFDGSTFLSAGWDGTVGRWNVEGELIRQYQLKHICIKEN